MKPAMFEYDDPQTVDETLDLLARYGDECKVLAGGQSLVPLMNFRLARPGRLIDINGVESLGQIKVENGRLRLGAMVRHAHLERSNDIAARWPLLHEAIVWVGHSQIRNRGTVGGSVAHADPAAELPCAFAALDAKFHVLSKRGPRVLRWDQIFVSELTTSLAPDELLTAIGAAAGPVGRRRLRRVRAPPRRLRAGRGGGVDHSDAERHMHRRRDRPALCGPAAGARRGGRAPAQRQSGRRGRDRAGGGGSRAGPAPDERPSWQQ